MGLMHRLLDRASHEASQSVEVRVLILNGSPRKDLSFRDLDRRICRHLRLFRLWKGLGFVMVYCGSLSNNGVVARGYEVYLYGGTNQNLKFGERGQIALCLSLYVVKVDCQLYPGLGQPRTPSLSPGLIRPSTNGKGVHRILDSFASE